MTDFYENRFNELECFLTTLEDHLHKLNREELAPISRQVQELVQLLEDEPLTAAKLTPKLLEGFEVIERDASRSSELADYKALKDDIASFVNFELPLWVWRPQLKSAAFDVLMAAWNLSVGGEFDVNVYVDLEDLLDDFLHTTDDNNDKLQLFIEALERYNMKADKERSPDCGRKFELALEGFTVAELIKEAE